MALRLPCMALAPEHPCMAPRHLCRMVAALHIMAHRHPCMMVAALLLRVGPGIPTTLTHLPGLRRNTNMPLTTNPPHPHKHMGEPRIPKHPATQTHHPPRSIHSTTRRHPGRQPCTTQTSSPPTLPPLHRGLTSPAPAPRATTKWHQVQQAIRTPIPQPATTQHRHPWPIRLVPAPALLATVQ